MNIRRLRHNWSSSRNLLFYFAASLGLTMPLTGQTGSHDVRSSVPKQLTYDVVSVKPHKAGDGTMAWEPNGGGYSGTNVTIKVLVCDAYNIKIQSQVTGFPKWADSARFDIEAKLDGDTAAALRKLPHKQQWEEQQLMLQTVLADRFKLKVHHEMQKRPIYELVLAKGGAKLQPSHASEGWSQWYGREIKIQAEPIASFASILSRVSDIDRVVVDKTGLTEDYDITLKWTPEDEQGLPDAGPSIFTAVQEQLGLKLSPTKGPVDILVIDHVEAPNAN